MRVLITSGATREPIDGVRCITNFSTGKTGAKLAERFAAEGWEVWYLHGAQAAEPAYAARSIGFSDFRDLDRKLRALLKERRFDAVIHAAAVADYSVEWVRAGSRKFLPGRTAKLDSKHPVTLRLKRNFKILDRLSRYARNPRMKIVAFKLTNRAGERRRLQAVRRLLGPGKADIVVHNDMAEFAGEEGRVFRIYEEGRKAADCGSRARLAARLLGRLRCS